MHRNSDFRTRLAPGSWNRAGLLLALGVLSAGSARSTPATPVITEPATEGQVISAYDVHMVTGPFVGAPGENHVCSDWEIRWMPSDQVVWSAPCVSGGALKVHIHLGDGEFLDTLAGQHQLKSQTQYKLRVRFQGDSGTAGTDWSDWAERNFVTAKATVIEPLILSDVSLIPSPQWRDDLGSDIILPAGSPPPSLTLEVPGAGGVLSFAGLDGTANQVTNPPALSTHGPVHVVCAAGSASISLAASRITFTDGSGQDREVNLPILALSAGQSVGFWVDESGGAFAASAVATSDAKPDFTTQVSASPVPWAIREPGYRIERFATGFQLPVNIAFVPNPGTGQDAPFFYVAELYGSVKMVTRGGEISDYATGLLNFDPTGVFPGSGELGLAGIVVEPASGDLFVDAVEAVAPETNNHFPRVMRLHSTDGGRTMASRTTILDFPTEPLGPSHQVSNLSIGPDGKLYVHIGDGELTTPAQDLTSVRGKILRVNFDGSAPPDNPFYNAADGLTATDLIYAYGFRNPFGGAWRALDGAHWEVENGPSVDRFAKVVAGRNYLWDGTDASMQNFAAYNWPVPHAPVNVAFVQPSTFRGSGFPADKMDHAFVAESGATYAQGSLENGKRLSEFTLDADGALTSGPFPLVEYIGTGRATAVALAAGPDGLYFSDLYKDFGAATPIEAGANILRIRYTGIADFSADVTSGTSALTVTFQDLSNVPSSTAWHWEFGDGTQSDEHNPVHTYMFGGNFDVRLTVTGAGGAAARQKASYILAQPALRSILLIGPGPLSPVTVDSRP